MERIDQVCQTMLILVAEDGRHDVLLALGPGQSTLKQQRP